jgi:hypothetical protein
MCKNGRRGEFEFEFCPLFIVVYEQKINKIKTGCQAGGSAASNLDFFPEKKQATRVSTTTR